MLLNFSALIVKKLEHFYSLYTVVPSFIGDLQPSSELAYVAITWWRFPTRLLGEFESYQAEISFIAI